MICAANLVSAALHQVIKCVFKHLSITIYYAFYINHQILARTSKNCSEHGIFFSFLKTITSHSLFILLLKSQSLPSPFPPSVLPPSFSLPSISPLPLCPSQYSLNKLYTLPLPATKKKTPPPQVFSLRLHEDRIFPSEDFIEGFSVLP